MGFIQKCICIIFQMTLSKVLGPAVSASPKNLIEQKIRGPHLQTYWIKNSGWSLAQSVFNKPSRWFECKFRLRTTILVFISAHALPCSLVFLLESRVFSTGLWEGWIWMPSGKTCSLHFATVSTSPYWLLPYTFSAQPMITLEFGTSGRGGGWNSEITILKLDMIWPNGLLWILGR